MTTDNFDDIIQQMPDDRLEILKNRIEDIIAERDVELMSRTMSANDLVRLFSHYGFETPPGTVFWKIYAPKRGRGHWGMQVGKYTHSCHIDTTEIIVLLVIEQPNGNAYEEGYADHWLRDKVVI